MVGKIQKHFKKWSFEQNKQTNNKHRLLGLTNKTFTPFTDFSCNEHFPSFSIRVFWPQILKIRVYLLHLGSFLATGHRETFTAESVLQLFMGYKHEICLAFQFCSFSFFFFFSLFWEQLNSGSQASDKHPSAHHHRSIHGAVLCYLYTSVTRESFLFAVKSSCFSWTSLYRAVMGITAYLVVRLMYFPWLSRQPSC